MNGKRRLETKKEVKKAKRKKKEDTGTHNFWGYLQPREF